MTTTLTDHTAPVAVSEVALPSGALPSGALPSGALPTLGWALRRALLGFTILFAAMGSIAVLMYASIDPDLDGAPLEQNAKNMALPISTTGANR